MTETESEPFVRSIDAADPASSEAGWLDAVQAGRVFVVKGALQALGQLEAFERLALDAIRTASSDAQADAVAADGFETVHKHLSGKEIYAAHEHLTQTIRHHHHDVVAKFVRDIGGHSGDLYISDKVWVRFFVPHDHVGANRELFSGRVGHLTPQNPHRDSWMTNAANASVIWFAMSRVRIGNGMIFYPDHWGRPVAHPEFEKRGFRIDTGIPLGKPVGVDLSPGDAIVFAGEHLHSSEINSTPETRFSLGFRFSVEPPRYGEGNRWYAYRNAALARGALAPLSGLRARLTPAYLRYLVFWRLGYWLSQRLGRGPTGPAIEVTAPSDRGVPDPPDVDPSTYETLKTGEIRPLNSGYAIARTEAGVVVFSRFCPHRGADLATGYLSDGALHCPWHNLGFDLETGASKCRHMEQLSVRRLTRA